MLCLICLSYLDVADLICDLYITNVCTIVKTNMNMKMNITACTVLMLLVIIMAIGSLSKVGAGSKNEEFAPVGLSNLLAPEFKLSADINSNKCIDIGTGAQRLSKLTLQDCSGQKNQRFWMSPFNGAIRSSQSMCLDIPNNQSASGVQVQVYDCNNSAAQKFKVIVRNGKSYIQKQDTNYCIDLTNENPANHTPIQLQSCNWGPSQRWHFKK